MKRAILFSIIFISLLFLLLNAMSNTQASLGEDKVDKAVYEKVKDGGRVRVMIEIREDRRSSFETMSAKSFSKGKKTYDNVVSVIIDEKELKNIESDSQILSVKEEPQFKILLINSTQIINASLSWNLKEDNINLTGVGQTICVIDTGVNYSHSDLGGCYGNNDASSSCKVIGGWDYCADDLNCMTEDNDPIDVEGHGTHVSGIVAANGSIKGVAPAAKLVVLKASNSSGSFSLLDVAASIDWCVENATKFNISVISMSLGGYNHTDYCDSNYPYLATSINAAVAANIAVVTATGNDGSTTQIVAPACIENATRVSSSTKTNLISSFSNRNALVKLLAPGIAINSTWINGGYSSESGTSMATPHVAGAIALMNQYLESTGRTKTPFEIEDILNDTGKVINDSGSSRNYSRINIFAAIMFLDDYSPSVGLMAPENNSLSTNVNQTLRCNATDLYLKNVTFYLWNSTNALINQTIFSASGAYYGSEVNVTSLSIGSYSWNCLYTDEDGNFAFAQSNYTLTISQISSNLITPLDGTITNNGNKTYNCSASSDLNSLSNITFYVWNLTSSIYNLSRNMTGLTNSSLFSYNITQEGTYYWNCLVGNNVNLSTFAPTNYSITYDGAYPILNVSLPVNGSWYGSGRFNVSINESGTCIYSLNRGRNNYTMSSGNNREFYATNATITDGSNYNVTYYCNDSAGNLNSTMVYFNIDGIYPVVELKTPYPEDVTATSARKIFYYNVSEVGGSGLDYCVLILNGDPKEYNYSASTSATNSFNRSISHGSYTWRVNCADEAGNIDSSSSESFEITDPDGGNNGGGDSDGVDPSGSSIYTPATSELNAGYIRNLSSGDKIRFNITNGSNIENHTFVLNTIRGNASIGATLYSSPIRFNLTMGREAVFNLSDDTYYDVAVRLERISNNKATVRIRVVNTSTYRVSNFTQFSILQNSTTNSTTNSSNPPGKNQGSYAGRTMTLIYISVVVLILVVSFILLMVLLGGNKDKEREEDHVIRIIRPIKT